MSLSRCHWILLKSSRFSLLRQSDRNQTDSKQQSHRLPPSTGLLYSRLSAGSSGDLPQRLLVNPVRLFVLSVTLGDAKKVGDTTTKVSAASKLPTSDSVLERILLDSQQPKVPKTTAEKVKEGGKDITYGLVIVVGVFALCALLRAVYMEAFGDVHAKGYARALSLVKGDDRCIELFGNNIVGYGEETSRRRRKHIKYLNYTDETSGEKRCRMLFYVSGSKGKGGVQVEMKEVPEGGYDFRYVIVETDELNPHTVILVDNR